MSDLFTLSRKELERLDVIKRVIERRLTQEKSAAMLKVGVRQIRRLVRAYEAHGEDGLISKKRGRSSNRKLPDDIKRCALAIVRQQYADFGPTLAHEKLVEAHGFEIGVDTLRHWMVTDGLWIPRSRREKRSYQPRNRRACIGELVQIDGSDHEWFEDRGPRCTLLVYVDDATSRLMELRFVASESAFDYFSATRSYLERHGKPMAFYSDKHSVFRVNSRETAKTGSGVSQFGRALFDVNIDLICANSPAAKGRVERANGTLQDRLVKELRLRGISNIEAANAFVPEFIEDYNRRFGKPPQSNHDAHRPLLAHDNLDEAFTWQEERKLTEQLVIHYKRVMYLVKDSEATRRFRNHKVGIYEREDGSVALKCNGTVLPYRIFDKNPHVDQGAIVENKILGPTLALIAEKQRERDEKRLQSPRMTLRMKERLKRQMVPNAPEPDVASGGLIALDRILKDQPPTRARVPSAKR